MIKWEDVGSYIQDARSQRYSNGQVRSEDGKSSPYELEDVVKGGEIRLLPSGGLFIL